MSKYKRIIQNLQDQIDDLDYQYWESSPSDPQKQIDLLYKMINRLNTMLYQLAVKEEEQSNHLGENR
jgi:NAD-dependent DNA ligase